MNGQPCGISSYPNAYQRIPHGKPMKPILNRLTEQLKRKGVLDARKVAIETLTRSGSLIPGTTKMTEQGIKRTEMGAAGRAIDRASKLSGKPAAAYVYSKKTNRATLK